MKDEDIIAELEEIAASHDGFVNPHDVVEFARDPESALHEKFTWDDGEAAEHWRLHQARNLIRVYVTITPHSPDPIRVAVSLPKDRHREAGYRLTVDVLSDDELRHQMLAMAMKELEVFRRKYQKFTELAKVFEAIAEFSESIQGESAVAAK